MAQSGSLFSRALIAILLMAGFYILALSIAGGLLYIPYAEWTQRERINIRLAFVCVASAFLILKSIVPRRDQFQAPGPLLEPSKQPRLFECLTKLSRVLKQPMPSEVYLVSDMNAWVTQRSGIMGFGSKRVMGLGLPLMQLLTIGQLEAVLVHEFGHYHGGDTRLGPWIYKTRSAIGRTLQTLSLGQEGFGWMTILQAPFRWYGNMFLRVTHAISRAQEFAADRLAAATIGSEPLVDGLRTIHRAAGACDYYLNNEVLPVVRRGFRPPIVDGFSKFLGTESIAQSIDESLEIELKWAEQGAYDTHPPLSQRIAAVQGLIRRKVQHDAPALTLIDNLDALEAQLIASWLENGIAAPKLIAWEETGMKVMLPVWEDLAKQTSHALQGITLKDLFGVVRNMDPFIRKLDVPPSGAPREALAEYASSALGAALACALHRSGWIIESVPGRFQLVNGERHFNPFTVIPKIVSGEIKEHDWNQMIVDLGLDPAMPLAAPPNDK